MLQRKPLQQNIDNKMLKINVILLDTFFFIKDIYKKFKHGHLKKNFNKKAIKTICLLILLKNFMRCLKLISIDVMMNLNGISRYMPHMQ